MRVLFNIKRIHIDERPKRASKRHGQHEKIIEGNLVVSVLFFFGVLSEAFVKKKKCQLLF